MDLEKLNKEYQGAKKDKLYVSLDKMEKQLEKLEKDLIDQKRQGEDAQTRKSRAQEDKDEARIKQAEQEIKDAKEAMEKTKKQIEKQKETITKTKGKVEKYIDEIAKDPEMKAQIDRMIAGIAKKEVKKLEDEKQNVTNLQELLEKQPEIESKIVTMINKRDKINECTKKIKLIEDELRNNPSMPDSEKSEKETEKTKATDKRKSIGDECTKVMKEILKAAKKSNIDISEKWIKEFFRDGSDKIAHNNDGKLNINKTLKNKVHVCDKKIKPYKTTLRNLGVQERQSQNGTATQQNPENLPATIEKPKFDWKHLIKSVKAWRDWKKQQKQYIDLGHIDENREDAEQQDVTQSSEPEELTPEQEEQIAREKAERNQKNREFRKALYYDIVQDYTMKRIEDLKKEDFRETARPQNNENEQQNSDDAR